MSNWYDSVETIDQNTVETTGMVYPYCQWVHGQTALEDLGLGSVAYTGGWFIPKDNLASAPAGWSIMTLKHSNGSKTEGYGSRDIEVAVLAARSRWTSTTGGQMRRFPWKEYDAALATSDDHKAVGHTQVAVVIKGLEHIGIFVLTLKGTTGKAWKQIVVDFRKCVVNTADAIAREKGKRGKFPFRAFWLRVGPKRKANGEPDFVEVGKKATGTRMVTPPVLMGINDRLTEADIKRLFVGEASLVRFNELYTEAQTWARDPSWDGSQEEAQPATSGEPAPVDDEEETPF